MDSTKLVTGMQWAGLPDENCDQIAKKIEQMCKLCVRGQSGHVSNSDIFRQCFMVLRFWSVQGFTPYNTRVTRPIASEY